MSLVKNNLICKCFLTENYFVSQTGQHVSFKGRENFLEAYSKFVEHSAEGELEAVLSDLEREQQRRLTLGHASKERKKEIARIYTPIHSHVYKLQEECLLPEFLSLAQLCHKENISQSELLSNSHLETLKGADRVYRIPIFTPKFCQDFKEEILHFENSDLPKSRPNTMNNYGIMLEEMLDIDNDLIKPLQEHYLSAISKVLFPECVKNGLDSHKAFVVTYRTEQDRDLDYHYDNAEVTCNVSLDDRFEGGELFFGSPKEKEQNFSETSFMRCMHRLGYGLLHRGQHFHGAMPIESGERQNLIVWMRSSYVRNGLCPMCGRIPELVETEGSGDGFTMKNVDVCAMY